MTILIGSSVRLIGGYRGTGLSAPVGQSRVLPIISHDAGGKARRLCVRTNFFEFRNIGTAAQPCKSQVNYETR